MLRSDEEKLKPCPKCGSTNLETDGSPFSEFYGHDHQDESVECLTCGFEVVVDSVDDFPCSCHHYDEMRCEIVRRWNEHPERAETLPCN